MQLSLALPCLIRTHMHPHKLVIKPDVKADPSNKPVEKLLLWKDLIIPE